MMNKDRIPCKECKHCEIHEVFGICQNEQAEIFGAPIFHQPVRLTASCPYGERS